jgi:hypothetical protein
VTHPNSLDLEAFSCGDVIESVTKHLDGCAACSAYVAKLRAVVAPPKDEARRRVERAARVSRNRTIMAASTVAVPLAAAAVILLVMRTPEPASKAPEPFAQNTGNLTDPETAFKGGVQIAVIRERAGEQKRFTSKVSVKPGDRLRVEVALDRSETILGAVIGEDGSYLELMRSESRDRGTHLSERSARIDANVTRGVIVVGTPDAVTRARSTKRMDGVSVIRVDWEGVP